MTAVDEFATAAPISATRTGLIRTLIADHDPISRKFLENALRGDEFIDVRATIDARGPVGRWPLHRICVVVLSLSQGDLLLGKVRELAARQIRPLVVGLDWTRRNLNDVLAAGAWGCLVKDTRPEGVLSGVHAVAHGNRVLSPTLLEFCIPRIASGSPRGEAELLRRLTKREREILALLSQGMTTSEAAKQCGVSTATVKSHVSHALAKLGARNRLQAVLMLQGD
ncbi:LuxR C-terminal-related transcriptional regulator [Streptomyces sp. NPDC007901]|uniref:LuxR C-terminal-related transcriptional regulator n=1 Tax=Streptomyces sp. NPDC007901 TaxID=3364785 RepID=UPI0036E003D2